MTAQAMQSKAPTITNGVNVSALFETINAVKANPAIAKFVFRATNAWQGGDRNRTTIKGFTGALTEQRQNGPVFEVENGEPDVLLGEDKAPNPVEWLLHALIGCLTTTLAYHAASRGIEIEDIRSSLEGDLDLQGFLGLSDKVRKGYSNIRVRMDVKTKASPTELKALAQMSPVFEMVSRSVPVDLTIATR
jgi:uncharacterized OsmC-like protein